MEPEKLILEEEDLGRDELISKAEPPSEVQCLILLADPKALITFPHRQDQQKVFIAGLGWF